MKSVAGVAIVVLVMATVAHAQSRSAVDTAPAAASPNPWFVRTSVEPAHVLASSRFDTSGDGARALTLEVGRQTDGTRDWHRVYNYPAYGIGFGATQFDRERELGRPFSAYGFFSWPFPVSRRAQLAADVAFGVAWNWNEFDRETNAANTALGADAAYQIDAGLSLRVLATARASVYAGVNLTHWSNGGTRQPNLGLANVGPKIGVRYDFAPRSVPPRVRADQLPRFAPSSDVVIGFAGSPKSAVAKTSTHVELPDRWREFSAFNLTTGLQRHFYRFGKAEAGADFTYDGATGARVETIGGRDVDSRAPHGQRYGAGIYGGYEHVIARVGILAQVGYTVWRGFEDEDVPRFYQRFATRFYLTERFWGSFAVRSMKFRKANHLEIGAGYRVRLR